MPKLRIGIDMRMAGEGFGIGRYIIELVNALLKLSSNFEYVLFFDRSFSRLAYDQFLTRGANCRLLSARYYSLEEQVKLPWLLKREGLSLMHFPNFNVPVLFPGKFLVTIHDLIHHRFPGKKKRNFLHRLGYRLVIHSAAHRAQRIIAVSNITRSDIINLLGVNGKKIQVIPEGISGDFQPSADQTLKLGVKRKYGIVKPYVMWVGVWRRYKNLPFLAQAFQTFNQTQNSGFQLVLAGGRDPNYPEIEASVRRIVPAASLVATGKILTSELVCLLSDAFCFVHPSLSEGFMLPSLEAQKCAVPVACSDIPIAREVHGDSALYFSPAAVSELVNVLTRLTDESGLRAKLVAAGQAVAQTYTWEMSARQTLALYQEIILSNAKPPRL